MSSEAGTPALPADAVREVGTLNVHVAATLPREEPFAGNWKAYAVTDIRYRTDAVVVYPMNLQLADTACAGEFAPEVAQKLTWLLRHADSLIATEPDTTRAAAVQIVVWQTLRNPQHNPPFLPRADLDTPSVDPAVNAIAATFTAITDANYAAGDSAIGVSVGAATGCSSAVTITGTPGTPVLLSTTSGGTLSADAVVIGQDGTATVTLAAPAGATVTINAVVNTGGVLVRADGVHAFDEHTTPTHLTKAPQELIFLAGATATATPGQLVCPGPTAPPGDGNVTGTPRGPVAKLKVVKTGPLTAVAGQVVVYRIKVTNTGEAAAQPVLFRDVLPSGLSLSKKPAGATIKRGLVQWSIPTLAPGASNAVIVKVKIDRSAIGTRCNKASASAPGLATAKTVACTAVRAVAGASTVPSVTG